MGSNIKKGYNNLKSYKANALKEDKRALKIYRTV